MNKIIEKVKRNKYLVILFLIVVLGAFLRFYKLDAQPFVTDEFLDINSAYGYSRTGEWKAWDFNFDKVSDNLYPPRDERTWIYRWPVAQLFKIFPPTETVSRSISAIWGLVSIVLLYFISVYFIRNKIIGLLAAFLFAVSSIGIVYDRMFRMYAMFFPVFLFFSWMSFRFFEEKYEGSVKIIKIIQEKIGVNVIWFLPALGSGLLSLHIHPLTLNAAAIFGAYFFVQAVLAYLRKKSLINKYSVTIAIILAAILVVGMVQFEPVYRFWPRASLTGGSTSYIFAAVSGYSNIIIAYILIILGISFYRNDKDKAKGIIWLSVSYITIIILAVFVWKSSFGLRFIFFNMSFGIIFMACGIYAIAAFLEANSLQHIRKRIFAGSLLFLILIIPNYSFLSDNSNVYESDNVNPDYRKAFQHFLKKRKEGDVLIARGFRSYYFRGANTPVVQAPTLAEIEEIVGKYKSGWIVTGDFRGDFKEDARKYIERNLDLTKEVKGVKIYRWEN